MCVAVRLAQVIMGKSTIRHVVVSRRRARRYPAQDVSVLESDDLKTETKKANTCLGVSLEHIERSKVQNKEEVTRGFQHLIAQAMRPYVDAISHIEAWSDGSSVKGILCDGNKITWKLRCVSECNRNSIPARYYGFHATSCEGRLACTGHKKIPWDSDLCNVCLKGQPPFSENARMLRDCAQMSYPKTQEMILLRQRKRLIDKSGPNFSIQGMKELNNSLNNRSYKILNLGLRSN
jgi:hypothetical protein